MALFKFVSFIGAACLLFSIAPWTPLIDFYARIFGSIGLAWGATYFMLRENEVVYGSVCIIFAVLVQPFYDIEYSRGVWMLISFLSGTYLALCGMLCYKIEKTNAINKIKREAELEMYRQNEKRLRAQEEEEDTLIHKRQ